MFTSCLAPLAYTYIYICIYICIARIMIPYKIKYIDTEIGLVHRINQLEGEGGDLLLLLLLLINRVIIIIVIAAVVVVVVVVKRVDLRQKEYRT